MPPPSPTAPATLPTEVLGRALALALASAVSLGLARFAYGLLLPPMRAELGWSYFLAGAMNTANAAGYLLGALAMPRLLARHDARALMLAGGALSAGLLALHALLHTDAALLALRLGTGLGSAASFVGGGLLAARLAGQAPAGARGAGLVLGVYYGGVGLGIVASAWLVPLLLEQLAAGWPAAWVMLGGLSALFTALTARGTQALRQPPAPAQRSGPAPHAPWWPMRWLLAGYLMFGLGYIGYMTFLITLLREQGRSGAAVTAYFTLVGLGVMASSWLWAGLLQRHADGRPMARLNGLLALATLLPVLSPALPVALVSGALFGAVFLAVVGSTTAFVRHNLAPAAWASGISAYTILFAAGQIVGPGLTGWVADAAGGGAGGLLRGLALSAALLALGAALASRQRALKRDAATGPAP